MTTAIVTIPLSSSVESSDWTPDQMKLITDVVAKNATPNELKLFLYRCKNMGLDPLKPGQVHFIKYNVNSPGTIVVGIEGFRSIAARTGKVAGIKRGVNLDKDGKLVSAWCEIYRTDWIHPAREEVPLAEYNAGNKIWNQMPQTMLKKVAECAALRMAFPDDLGGVYESAELDHASSHQPPAEDGVQKDTYSPKYGRFAKKHLEDCDPEALKEEVLKIEAEAREAGRDPLPWQKELIKNAEPLIIEYEQANAKSLRGEIDPPAAPVMPVIQPRVNQGPKPIPAQTVAPKITPEPEPSWDVGVPTVVTAAPAVFDPYLDYEFQGNHSFKGRKIRDFPRHDLKSLLERGRGWYKSLGKDIVGPDLQDFSRIDDYLRISAPPEGIL